MTVKADGEIREKLIATKQKWAKEGRLLTGTADTARENRLPPGQRLVRDRPVLDLGVTPHIETEDFRLVIDGEVENPLALDFKSLAELPRFNNKSDIHCVTSWSRYDNHWEGVATLDIAALAEVRDTAKHVLFTAHDGYTTNVKLDQFLAQNALLACQWEGAPISSEHGGPVRLVLPDLYFWKSPKWVRQITFSVNDKPGFWEVRGYHNNGDPWAEERYS